MQLIRILILTVLVLTALPTAAQSLSPMRKSGHTPSDVKGFRLTVGNPYTQRMIFALQPTEPGFAAAAAQAEINPAELILAPGASRQVILAFEIPPDKKERTVGLCVYPKYIEGPVLPRVCGTYAGTRLHGAGG